MQDKNFFVNFNFNLTDWKNNNLISKYKNKIFSNRKRFGL